MKLKSKIMAGVTALALAGAISAPGTADAGVNPSMYNPYPATYAQPLFDPWTSAVNPQTVTNQTAIALVSGYGRTVCYGSRVDATWANSAPNASIVASAWQAAGGSCFDPVITEYVRVSTVTVFNDQILPGCFHNPPGPDLNAASGTIAQIWVIRQNCGVFSYGWNPPWDAIPARGNYRQFTCVTTPHWSGCHSPANHQVL